MHEHHAQAPTSPWMTRLTLSGSTEFVISALKLHGSVANEALQHKELVLRIDEVQIVSESRRSNFKSGLLTPYDIESFKEEKKNRMRKILKGTTMMKRKNHKPNAKFISSIRGLYFTMNFLGLWPQKNPQNWYNLIWYVQSTGFVFELFGATAGLIMQKHDARKILENLSLLIPLTGVCVKWVIFAIRRETVGKLFTEEDWTSLEGNTLIGQSVPENKRIMRTYSRFANIFFYNHMAVTTVAIINFVRDSLAAGNSQSNITNMDELLLLPNSWYPVDYNQTSNIQFLMVTQTMSATIMMLANASMDSIFIAVILNLCGQFKILRYFIETIRYDSSRPNYCETKVRLMVKRHQMLLRVGEIVQKAFSLVILEQLMNSVLAICFIGYAIITEMESNKASTTFLLKTGCLGLTVVQIMFTYCLVGDILKEQNIGVAKSIYNTQWYNCTRPINLSFSIVVIRARKPVDITGTSLFPLSLENFTVLIKAGVSYLSVLRAMGVSEG